MALVVKETHSRQTLADASCIAFLRLDGMVFE